LLNADTLGVANCRKTLDSKKAKKSSAGYEGHHGAADYFKYARRSTTQIKTLADD
jgi:hypothetical protein